MFGVTRPRALLAGVTLAALIVAAPGVADAADPVKRLTARSGSVTAQVSLRKDVSFYRDIRLRITRAGTTLFDKPVQRIRACDPCSVAASATPVVRDLNGDREPEVLLHLYSGGASCCSSTVVFYFASGRYRFTIGDWLRYEYRVEDLGRDGTVELVSRNPAFGFAFTIPAYSAPPLQIWRFSRGRLRDVTREFPRVIARDARELLRHYEEARRNSKSPEVRGILAGYMAEQYLLGRQKQGWRVLERAFRRGELGPTGDDGFPTGRNYLRELRAFLRSNGYARR